MRSTADADVQPMTTRDETAPAQSVTTVAIWTAPKPLPGARAARRPRRRVALVFAGLSVALIVAVVVSAGSGQLHVPPGEVLGSILHRIGVNVGALPHHPRGDTVLWEVRFPRIVMAVLVGASLGAAGAIMQGIFGNPLA